MTGALERTPELLVSDAPAWRAWLDVNADLCDGVWLILAKKGVTEPTSLRYQDALVEALCSGWIDGQRRTRDDRTYRQRFTPRRARSNWSVRNVDLIARLEAEGRMRPRGVAEVDKAKADGRWDRAYPGQATAEPPGALRTALDARPEAAAAFAQLSRAARFSLLHPILTAADDEARARHVGRAISTLTAGT